MEVQTDVNTESANAQVADTNAEAQVAEATNTVENQDIQTQEAGPQEPAWSDDQKAYIEALRKENAKYRTKAKELDSELQGLNGRFSKLETGLKTLFGGEEEDLTPEEQINGLSQQNETLNFKSAVMEAAIEYGVGKESIDYFSYLLEQTAGSLEEGQELSEEDVTAIAQKAKSVNAPTSTSVGGTTVPQGAVGDSELTVEKFADMTLTEKSLLFQKQPETYKALAAQAKKDGILI